MIRFESVQMHIQEQSPNALFLQVPDATSFVNCPLVLDCHVPITIPHFPKLLATLSESETCIVVSDEYTLQILGVRLFTADRAWRRQTAVTVCRSTTSRPQRQLADMTRVRSAFSTASMASMTGHGPVAITWAATWCILPTASKIVTAYDEGACCPAAWLQYTYTLPAFD
jgi:hypothetical protein